MACTGSSCSGTCCASCTGTCKSSCSVGCYTDCTTGCHDVCNTTQTSCSCSGACYTGCSGKCKTGCTGTCNGSCNSGCVTGCSGHCVGTCTGSCTGKCTSTCDSGCTGNCKNKCYGTCSGKCNSGCSSTNYADSYTAIANLDLTAQAKLTASDIYNAHRCFQAATSRKSDTGASITAITVPGYSNTTVTAAQLNTIKTNSEALGYDSAKLTYSVSAGGTINKTVRSDLITKAKAAYEHRFDVNTKGTSKVNT